MPSNLKKTCERCGESFGCFSDKKEPCWCVAMPKLSKIPEQYKDCLCPKCLNVFAEADQSEASPLTEGEDFFLEKGLMVFTRQYHLKRGYCCGSGCRFCPYK
jgi:hypothetical protein